MGGGDRVTGQGPGGKPTEGVPRSTGRSPIRQTRGPHTPTKQHAPAPQPSEQQPPSALGEGKIRWPSHKETNEGRNVTQGRGGGRGHREVCVPEVGLKFPAPLISFVFFQRKMVLLWWGWGWVVGCPGPKPAPPPPLPRGGYISRGHS